MSKVQFGWGLVVAGLALAGFMLTRHTLVTVDEQKRRERKERRLGNIFDEFSGA